MTLVSVVMPVLNGGPWLAEAIGSILAQTHRALELIVVDDGSSDDSRDIAAAAAGRDGRVRPLSLPPLPGNTSSARAANAGIAEAQGALIARMDADDIALPHRLERQIAFMEARGLEACGTLADAFGAEARHYWYPETREGIGRELLFRVGILHPTLLAGAGLMRDHPYRPEASHEDFEWQTRVWAAGARMGNVPETLLRHRTHPGQAHVRHAALFHRDLRQYRFRHLMRLFPGTRPADYQALAAVAEKQALTDPADLAAAARWLARLAVLPEEDMRPAMAHRWDKVCARAGLAETDTLRGLYAEALAARAGGVNRYRAYGLDIVSERPLPLRPSHAHGAPDLDIRHAGVSPPLPPSGPDRRSLAATESGWTLRYDNDAGGWMAFDYVRASRRLRVSGSVAWEECTGPISGVVCAVLLRLEGATLLHAACLEMGGAAAAILGASGHGKSTLAAALALRGAALVGEDLLVLRDGAGGFAAEPGPAALHLLPDAHRALVPPHIPASANADGKLRLVLPAAGTDPVPLGAVFVLDAPGDRPPALEQLSGPAAVAALSAHLYGSGWIRPMDGADLRFCARLARDVPVFAVSRPWSLAALGETAGLLEAALQGAR